MNSTFTKYQVVKWTSQSQGHRKTKVGYVVAVLPALTNPDTIVKLLEFPCRPAGIYGGTRAEVSYLVAVPTKTGEGKAVVYWPLTSKLEVASVTEASKLPQLKTVQLKPSGYSWNKTLPTRELEHLRAQLKEATERIHGLEAARIAYAKEFPLKNGEPDVGNIHQNIRDLKTRDSKVLLTQIQGQLYSWIQCSSSGGWSSHLNTPMSELATKIGVTLASMR